MDGNMRNLSISILEFIAVNPVQAGEEWAMDIEETPVSGGIYIDGCDVMDIIESIEKPYKKREGLMVGKDYGHIQASWLYKDLCEVTNDTSYSYKYGVYLFCCRDCGEPGCWSVRSDSIYVNKLKHSSAASPFVRTPAKGHKKSAQIQFFSPTDILAAVC